jgi:hypothetical protein
MRILVRLVVAALAIGGTSLIAQSWSRVQSLKPGDRVSVVDSSGQKHKGTLSSITNEAISIQTRGGETSVERSRVRRVEVTEGSRRLRNALIGAGIGIAAGLVADNTLGTYFRNESGETSGARALTYIAPAGVFAAIGATQGTHSAYKSR